MSLTKDQVQHIATLARLKLADAELDDVVDKLSRIVELQSRERCDVLDLIFG